jgi:hypothetical protein
MLYRVGNLLNFIGLMSLWTCLGMAIGWPIKQYISGKFTLEITLKESFATVILGVVILIVCSFADYVMTGRAPSFSLRSWK